jgi:hypothetical protein
LVVEFVDVNEIKKFIGFYVSEGLRKNEGIFINLLARKKYCPPGCTFGKGERLLDVKLITGPATVEELTNIIARTVEKWYTVKWYSKDNEIPRKALSTSVLKNPLNLETLAKEYTKSIFDLTLNGNYTEVFNYKARISHVAMKYGQIRKHYLVDIDVPGEKGLEIARDFTNKLGGMIIQTHGGYHVLIKGGERMRHWPELKKKYATRKEEVTTDGVIVVALPGTLRGGTPVKIIEILPYGFLAFLGILPQRYIKSDFSCIFGKT